MACYTAPLTAPRPAEAMERFIETEDITCLEKPLLFERDDSQFEKMLCCQAVVLSMMSCGLLIPCMPVASCCPYTFADQYSLRLDKDALTFESAGNDCCCHIFKTLKTVPLDKVQDVELRTDCALSCFGLKAVNVQTAGQGGAIAPEVSATFLKSPEKAREAIRLAVKLHQQGKMQGGASSYAAPGPGTWGEMAPAVPVAAKGAGLAQRLQGLEGLVTRGVLAKAEADTLKVAVLAAPDDAWLGRLIEIADLYDKRLITAEEFSQMKASLLAQIRAAL